MPRFYSLSSDPRESKSKDRRIIEIAVTIHEHEEGWREGNRTGVGSGFFERCARRIIDGGADDVRVPMFRGLMANPLAKQFQTDGPMLLIGAGVGIAPFRGFVQRRLQSANCANKVWVIQGVRDSLLDELYSGEWGEHEAKIRSVVQSRVGTGRYVQEEVFAQADIVWSIVNSLDGRVFVCGSSKGMGEGVHESLVKVVMKKSMLGREQAEEFWEQKRKDGQKLGNSQLCHQLRCWHLFFLQ
ncbi:ferredoxin reductase-like protein [Tuber magnatum]|uniref:Ferredoxin reductase-like protein n=1 Tax=Tuber magnatum TaxID=42249 RepID=A0A317SVS4_9PEZI|nr:ferredoxin reductase-like protein [Tuber magnatum]